MKKRILFVVNSPEYFISHRLAIGQAAQKSGYDVHLAGPGEPPARVTDAGIPFHSIPMSRQGMHPFRELATFISLIRLFRELRPAIVHLVTIKPVLYGGIAARLTRVPGVAAAIAGLGLIFISRGLRARLLRGFVKGVYRLALRHPNLKVIFQNPDDREVMLSCGAVRPRQAVLISGSGVNLADYSVRPEAEGIPVVAFASRLLWDKGVGEFVEAARLLKERGVQARFWLIGSPDPGNPATVTDVDLHKWRQEGLVEVLGYRTDIGALFGQASIVALPSYYGEGLPRVLIEAAACGRPVVTTDHPGCRHAIAPDESGLLVPPRDAGALADALARLLQDASLRRRLGEAGRALAERRFAIERVVGAHMAVYRDLLAGSDHV